MPLAARDPQPCRLPIHRHICPHPPHPPPDLQLGISNPRGHRARPTNRPLPPPADGDEDLDEGGIIDGQRSSTRWARRPPP
ncbi:hypothetical protein R3P38DRAFT_3238683 [Favolaschia claudopus]|uniref:Uncharacterized protein n=1 Tax=Favolaschia claudopus TaxID=2862362 RepID=A0AAV9Z948_9AGAR